MTHEDNTFGPSPIALKTVVVPTTVLKIFTNT